MDDQRVPEGDPETLLDPDRVDDRSLGVDDHAGDGWRRLALETDGCAIPAELGYVD